MLADGAKHLSVAERVGVLGDVDLLLGAGETPAGVALALVPEFSKDPAPLVVQAAANIAGLLKTESVPGDLREKGRAIHPSAVWRAGAKRSGGSPNPATATTRDYFARSWSRSSRASESRRS